MDFFFYITIPLLFLLLPIPVVGQGSFRSDKRTISLTLRVYGIKILSVLLYFSEKGIFLSLNGKQGKPIKPTDKPISFHFDPLAAIRIRSLALTIAAGGEPVVLSSVLGIASGSISTFLSYLEARRILDRGSIRLLPRYTGEHSSVNFSIKIFTSLAMALGALIHTPRGEKE